MQTVDHDEAKPVMAITPKMAAAGKKVLLDLGYEGVDFVDAQKVFEAMFALSSVAEQHQREIEKLKADLRTVQNAAKTIASAHGTELEHLRQNHTYDHRIRAQHESLMERDAQMTDALLAAESSRDAAIAEAVKAERERTILECAHMVDGMAATNKHEIADDLRAFAATISARGEP